MTDSCFNWNYCAICKKEIDVKSLTHIIIVNNVCYHKKCYNRFP